MTAGPDPAPGPADRVLVVTRVFDAPRELVFTAWTEAEHLLRWWGPKGWTTPFCTVDLRPGGVWHYCFRSPTGEESWGRAVYREITPPERLVYVDAFSDPDGNVIPPEMLITVTFVEQDGRTLVTIRTLFATPADRDAALEMGMMQGMAETLDRLAEHLATA